MIMPVRAQMRDVMNAASTSTDMKGMITEMSTELKETSRSTLRKKDLWSPVSSTSLREDSDF